MSFSYRLMTGFFFPAFLAASAASVSAIRAFSSFFTSVAGMVIPSET